MSFYDEYYFKHGCGRPYERTPEWLQFFAGIADKIVREIGPRTVLDAGCAMGFLVEALRQRGVEAFGIDISEYAIQKVYPDIKRYCFFGSITDTLPQKYDLIVCIEILEHLSPRDAERAVENLCQHSDDVLFSSTPTDYKEATHFNVQPPDYWAELFARHGFFRDVDFDASFIALWAARFRRRSEPASRVARDYERKFWLLWKENADLRAMAIEMRNQLASDEQTIQTQQQTIQSLQAQLSAITSSRSWRSVQRLGRLLRRKPGVS
jgi:SAM-dependent methyltransferase